MAGKYFDYPSASLGIDSDDIAKPILLFQAARAAKLKREAEARAMAEQERHHRETEMVNQMRAQTEEARAMEVHRASMERERMASEEFRRKQAMDLATGLPKVSESLNPASPRYNPGVGNAMASALGVHGLEQQRAPEPQAPQIPQELEQSVDFQLRKPYANSLSGGAPAQTGDKNLDPLIARALGEGRATMTAQAQSDLERQGVGRELLVQQDAYEEQMAQLPETRRREAQSPVYTGQSQFGPIRLAPVEQEQGIQRHHDEGARRIMALADRTQGVDPHKAEEVRLVADKVARRIITPDEANDDLRFLLSQRTGVEKARLAAEGQARKGSSFEETNAIRAETLFTSQFNQLMTNFGFKGDVMKLKDLVDTRSQLRKDNAALDTQAGANFAKQANGAGVLTDADFQRFWGMVGGLGANPYTDWNSFIEHIWSGKIPAEKRKLVIAAIEQRMSESVQRLGFARERADAWAAEQPPEKQAWYRPLRAGHLGWLPEKQQETPKGTPQSQAAGAAKTNARDQEAFRKYQAEGSKLPPEVKAKLEAKFKALGLMK